MTAVVAVSLAMALASVPRIGAAAEPSTCFGTVSRGALNHGVKLPLAGKNFTAYSALAAGAGRTYVHSTVAEVVLAAYAALEQASPATVFVYGETGFETGGPFAPHRTHQNGLSVDFMVPVRDRRGRSVPLPAHAFNRFGYDLEFDAQGRAGDHLIDFDALADHLIQLERAARSRGVGITQMILDPPFIQRVYATRHGDEIRRNVKFMQGKPWVRHDEHFHVDFAVPCKPLAPAKK